MKYKNESKLDYILQECRDELSRQRTEIEWHNISKKICDDPDAKRDKPLFLMYIDKLEEDNLIKKNGTGYLATYKGLFFKGYVENIKKENISKRLQTAQTWAISIGTAIAGIYALIQIFQILLCKLK